MFLLKKFTNFTQHKLIHESKDFLYVITPSSVELYTPDIAHVKSYKILDNISNTIFDKNLYVLTSSYLIEIDGHNFIKYDLENIYIKVQIYLNKIFLIGRNIISIYDRKMNKEHDIIKIFDDLIVDFKYIYLLENDSVTKYKYLNKILIKLVCDKQVEDLRFKNEESRFIADTKKSLVMFKDVLYIFDFVDYSYIHNNILYIKNEECFLKIEDNKLVEDTRNISHMSEDGKYMIYNNQIMEYKEECFLKMKDTRNISHMSEDGKYMIYNNQIMDFVYKVYKLPDLTNIKNIKLINISSVRKDAYNIKEENDNIYKTDKFIIFCKDISKSISVDENIFLINPSFIYRYSVQEKVKFISKIQMENIYLITDRFIYYTNKSLYYIYDMKDNKKYKYIKKDIVDINKLNDKLIIYEHKFVRIYQINTQKYKRKPTPTSHSDSYFIDDSSRTLYCKESKNNLIYLGYDKLIKIYKSDKIYKEFSIDGVPLDIKIYINDVSKYFIILDLSFNILGMVYLDEYIQRWYIKKDRLYFVSTLGNIYRIKEGIKNDNQEYFKKCPRINIVVE
ncbi:hypothetical protein P3W45_000725 [Vairimorpha bombi]